MIVKVEVTSDVTDKGRMIRASTKDRTFCVLMPATLALRDLLKRRKKAYFYGYQIDSGPGKPALLHLNGEVRGQRW